jgi:rare lipoprotein A
LEGKGAGVLVWHKFHGRRTASGEMFSMYGLTAAHRTLPIPSYARVRHAKSGKAIIVRINDRGPFHSSRVIDLSYAAAVKLGIVSAGSASVEIERLTFDEIRTGAWKRGTVLDAEAEAVAALPLSESAVDAQPLVSVLEPETQLGMAPPVGAEAGVKGSSGSPPPLFKAGSARAYTSAAKGFWVQLAAMGKRDSVDKLYQKAAAALADLSPMLAVFQEASHFKLQVGPYESRREALVAAEQAREVLQLTPMVVERR